MDPSPLSKICALTHRQILWGKCPRCDQPIGDVERESGQAERVWNIEVLAGDLDDPSNEIRRQTTANLLLHTPTVDVAAPLLSKALRDSDGSVRFLACQALSSLGRDLDNDVAKQLESMLEESEHQLAYRLVLVSYFQMAMPRTTDARLKLRRHVLWLIENAPEIESLGTPDCLIHASQDQVGYEEAKRLWVARTDENPRNAKILINAASFFTLEDPDLSERLLRSGQTLEPNNPEWSERLGHLYSLRSRKENPQQEVAAVKGFEAHLHADKIRSAQPSASRSSRPTESNIQRLSTLQDLAMSAFAAKEYEHARNHANELLSLATSTELDEYFRNDGNSIHYGNQVLGRVALVNGDVESAKRHLLASGRTKGSPNLLSFGPNMSLARSLLELGEKDTVLEYFQLCSVFWTNDFGMLKLWTEQTKQGKIPDFGANMDY